jgi:hypothetical protein
LKRDSHAGDLYVFCGKRGHLTKILWQDGTGMSLYAKRLERGRFLGPSPADGIVAISAAQRDSCVLERINFELLLQAREPAGREPSPSTSVIDSQSFKATEAGGPRGFDAAKKINGRMRHLVTDTTGPLVGAEVHPADVQGRDGAPLVIATIHDPFLWLRHRFADSVYAGDKLLTTLTKFGNYTIQSCAAWPPPSVLKFSRAAGSSNALLPGSIVTATLPKIWRPQSPAPKLSFMLNSTYTILSRTLSENFDAHQALYNSCSYRWTAAFIEKDLLLRSHDTRELCQPRFDILLDKARSRKSCAWVRAQAWRM